MSMDCEYNFKWTGDKENDDGASEDPFEDSIVEVDVQLVEDKGELLEQEQNVKQDEQEVGKSVISDEEFGPKDVGFDPAEDPKKATTDEVRDEPAEPEEDPSHFGMYVYLYWNCLEIYSNC